MGLRQGEALGLRWQDVDLELGYVRVVKQLQRIDRKLQLVEPKTKRSRRTARDMGHLPLWGERGLLKRPFRFGKAKRVIIHINNTNPVLNEESAEYRAVREAGWEIAYDGMEFDL